MAGTTLTRELANASGEDAANRQMRNAGRSKWTAADMLLAGRVSARLSLHLGGHEAFNARAYLLNDCGREGKRIVREFDARTKAAA